MPPSRKNDVFRNAGCTGREHAKPRNYLYTYYILYLTRKWRIMKNQEVARKIPPSEQTKIPSSRANHSWKNAASEIKILDDLAKLWSRWVPMVLLKENAIFFEKTLFAYSCRSRRVSRVDGLGCCKKCPYSRKRAGQSWKKQFFRNFRPQNFREKFSNF